MIGYCCTLYTIVNTFITLGCSFLLERNSFKRVCAKKNMSLMPSRKKILSILKHFVHLICHSSIFLVKRLDFYFWNDFEMVEKKFQFSYFNQLIQRKSTLFTRNEHDIYFMIPRLLAANIHILGLLNDKYLVLWFCATDNFRNV